jgi:hypothetical protein
MKASGKRQSGSGVECIDITEHLSFNLGNAFESVFWRNRKGDPVENLERARRCIARERDLWRRLAGIWRPRPVYEPLPHLVQAIASTEPEPIGNALGLIAMAEWSDNRRSDTSIAIIILEREIERLKAPGSATHFDGS